MTDKNKNLYPWGRDRPFNDYSGFARSLFGERVQKISIDAGFTCPNRDGTKGRGGCSFCDNKTFNPAYCAPATSITDQLNQGIAFFKSRYPGQKYLAYFQAYSNTYGSLDLLRRRYEEALNHKEVIGIVVGTRPDCISDELLAYLDLLTRDFHVTLEFGVESTNEDTLLRIHRGHTYHEVISAVEKCSGLSFLTGLHLILGLPGEDEESILEHANQLNQLSFDLLKLHQMQIIRGTRIEKEFEADPNQFLRLDADSYIDLVIRFIERLNPDFVIERFISESPPDKLIAPKWGLKNFEFVSRLEAEMKRRNSFQGRLFMD